MRGGKRNRNRKRRRGENPPSKGRIPTGKEKGYLKFLSFFFLIFLPKWIITPSTFLLVIENEETQTKRNRSRNGIEVNFKIKLTKKKKKFLIGGGYASSRFEYVQVQ